MKPIRELWEFYFYTYAYPLYFGVYFSGMVIFFPYINNNLPFWYSWNSNHIGASYIFSTSKIIYETK